MRAPTTYRAAAVPIWPAPSSMPLPFSVSREAIEPGRNPGLDRRRVHRAGPCGIPSGPRVPIALAHPWEVSVLRPVSATLASEHLMIASVSTIRGTGGPLQEKGALTENTRLAGEAMEQWLHEFEGYLGALFLADEGGRTVRALTFWETPEDATRSQAARMAMRDDMAAHAGLVAEKTETYSVAFSDVEMLT